jgi:hypothetical protein
MPPVGAEFDDLLAKWQGLIGTVPPPAAWVCPRCCGPRDAKYSVCYGCSRVFGAAPAALRSRVVPLTSTLEEGPWYTQLVSYKTTSREPWALLGGLVTRFTILHADRISELLDGAPTATTVVPSKRGKPMLEQPLYQVITEAVKMDPASLPQPRVLLEHTGDSVLRQSYAPNAFRVPKGQRVSDARVVLLEDSWTSGATCISAAGALLEAGAAQVVVLPIARLVKESFWGDAHPYLKAMRVSYDIGRWPRGD